MFNHCIDMDYGEGCDLYYAELRTARKEHQCGECHQLIQPGQRYEYVSTAHDGIFLHFKTCMICCAIRDDLADSFIHGELWAAIRELYGLDYDEILEDPDGRHGWDRWDDDRAWAAYVQKLERARIREKEKALEYKEFAAVSALCRFFYSVGRRADA